MDYSQLYDKVEQSVVQVVQLDAANNIVSSASGGIVGDGSLVITCSHCCDSRFLTGVKYDENRVIIGNIIFNDTQSDIAVLNFDIKLGKPLKMVDSSCLRIGNDVFTIGFPYNGDKTLVVGNVASFENELIKINASVNNGNSGGPLFNLDAEVIGIVNAKLGNVSRSLQAMLNRNYSAAVYIGGVDPIRAMQDMIRDMQRNLNLGIGYAIPTTEIKRICQDSGSCKIFVQ